jgi:hypothetical protein
LFIRGLGERHTLLAFGRSLRFPVYRAQRNTMASPSPLRASEQEFMVPMNAE